MAAARVHLIGIDETTSARALAARRGDGEEGFAGRKITGAAFWNGDEQYPAFDLLSLPRQLLDMLDELEAGGFKLAEKGRVSISCRQHDQVILNEAGELLTPAISWQCNAAREEAELLNADSSIVKAIGNVAPRLILPKLMKVLKADPSLRSRIWRVMTTGDYVGYMLTGSARLHTSEAMSNGLFDRGAKGLPAAVLSKCQLDAGWFPEIIGSGQAVGTIGSGSPAGLSDAWRRLRERLAGWEFMAGLGDNHASAVGCGVRGSQALLTSLGTSGTNNWVHKEPPATDAILGFGYYADYLWLTMLGDCGSWYNRALDEFAHPFEDDHAQLNRLASQAEIAEIVRVPYHNGELYRPGWTRLSTSRKVASVQFSIAFELLWRMRTMLQQMDRQGLVRPSDFILTGGLSQSEFLRHLYHVGVRHLAGRDCPVLLSGRSGPLRYKTTAYGALINAEFAGDLSQVPAARFPTVPCPAPGEAQGRQLRDLLAKCFDLLDKAPLPSREP